MVEAHDLSVLADDEISPAAGFAGETVSAVPADALACFLHIHALADGIDAADDLVTRCTGVIESRPPAFLDEDIAVTDAAGIDRHANFLGTGVGYISFDDLEIAARFWNLYGFHLSVRCLAHVRRFRATAVHELVSRKPNDECTKVLVSRSSSKTVRFRHRLFQRASSQIVLAWLLQRSLVLLPIPNTSSVGYVEDTIAASDIALTEDEMARLNE